MLELVINFANFQFQKFVVPPQEVKNENAMCVTHVATYAHFTFQGTVGFTEAGCRANRNITPRGMDSISRIGLLVEVSMSNGSVEN